MERRRISPWPELMKPDTAARMLDLSQSSFRMVYPVLCAHFGLRIQGACGPKFRRDNLLAVMEDLRERGQDISVNTRRRVVRIGDEEYRLNGSRSGKSGRGRPRKAEVVK